MLYAWLEAQREFFRACQPWAGAAQRAGWQLYTSTSPRA